MSIRNIRTNRYGTLPPETRVQQASLFNNPKSSYDVLVASDAIGMGLNLYVQTLLYAVPPLINDRFFVLVTDGDWAATSNASYSPRWRSSMGNRHVVSPIPK